MKCIKEPYQASLVKVVAREQGLTVGQVKKDIKEGDRIYLYHTKRGPMVYVQGGIRLF